MGNCKEDERKTANDFDKLNLMVDAGDSANLVTSREQLMWQCVMLATAFCVSLLVAMLAFELQQLGFAPAVVFPLAVGAAAGGGLRLAERLVGERLRRGRWVIAAVCALAAVVGQEAIGYVKVQRPQDAARLSDPRLELLRDEGFAPAPTSFTSYLAAHVRDEPLWWTLDLLLALAGGFGVVLWLDNPRMQSAGQKRLQ